MSRLFLGLVHYPVYNKRMEIITTSITNLDLHDIARNVMTYGLEKYFIIHPLVSQQDIIQDILDYWQKGYGAQYNPCRQAALAKVELSPQINTVLELIQQEYQKPAKIIVTDAQQRSDTISYGQMRENLNQSFDNYLLLFGTGWGLDKELMKQADYRLPPVQGCGQYNHLSVRSAAAIILDRLCGEKWW